MYLLPLIVTRGRFSIFFTVNIFEAWSEKISSSYSATDCARSRARNRAVKEINGSLKVRELDISIKSDEMRSWLRIKLIVDVDDQLVLGVTCLYCLHSATSLGRRYWAALTTNILLYFYIYNFNPIFNSIQRSELNCQFAKNV